jgi:uncharacterized membrane protein
VADAVRMTVRRAFLVDGQRTALQDVSFAFEQLAEMAVRALSAGINDPATAVHCVDRIGAALARFVVRELPQRWRCGEDGKPRVLVEPVRLETLLARTVDPIARNASHHVAVWERLAVALQKSEQRARRSTDRTLLHARRNRLETERSRHLSGEGQVRRS